MALIRWDPFAALSRLDAEFDELVRRAWGIPESVGFVPAVDVVRDGTDMLITIELPGVDIDKDVEIEVVPGRLSIVGSKTTESETTKGHVMVRELRSGSFRREFALPEQVTAEDLEASYDNGMLTVTVHNMASVEPEPTKIVVTSTPEALESSKDEAEPEA